MKTLTEERLKEIATILTDTQILALQEALPMMMDKNNIDVRKASTLANTYNCGFMACMLEVFKIPEDQVDKILKYHELKKMEMVENIKDGGCLCGECNKNEND